MYLSLFNYLNTVSKLYHEVFLRGDDGLNQESFMGLFCIYNTELRSRKMQKTKTIQR